MLLKNFTFDKNTPSTTSAQHLGTPTTKFEMGVRKIVVGSNLVAIPLFAARIAEDLL